VPLSNPKMELMSTNRRTTKQPTRNPTSRTSKTANPKHQTAECQKPTLPTSRMARTPNTNNSSHQNPNFQDNKHHEATKVSRIVTENQMSTNMFSTISKFQYIDQKRDNLNRKKEPSNNVTHTHAIHNYQTYALIRYTACFKIPAKS